MIQSGPGLVTESPSLTVLLFSGSILNKCQALFRAEWCREWEDWMLWKVGLVNVGLRDSVCVGKAGLQ